MKLQFFFLLMDALILLAYPVVFIVSKIRKSMSGKR